MTIKEQTIKRIENQKEKNAEEQAEYGRVCVFNRLTLEYYENVLKDLEVLEILKKYITIFEYPKRVENLKYIFEGGYITKEEYQKIKEWLDNDR